MVLRRFGGFGLFKLRAYRLVGHEGLGFQGLRAFALHRSGPIENLNPFGRLETATLKAPNPTPSNPKPSKPKPKP